MQEGDSVATFTQVTAISRGGSDCGWRMAPLPAASSPQAAAAAESAAHHTLSAAGALPVLPPPLQPGEACSVFLQLLQPSRRPPTSTQRVAAAATAAVVSARPLADDEQYLGTRGSIGPVSASNGRAGAVVCVAFGVGLPPLPQGAFDFFGGGVLAHLYGGPASRWLLRKVASRAAAAAAPTSPGSGAISPTAVSAVGRGAIQGRGNAGVWCVVVRAYATLARALRD